MSLYVKFVLDRSGVPAITSMTILEHGEEWANRQIADEFRVLYPGVSIAMSRDVDPAGRDLIVLPYDRDFMAEQPGGVSLYRRLSSCENTWVMLYGLCARRIDVMPAPGLTAFVGKSRRVMFLYGVLRRLRLLGLVRAFHARRKPS
jgi:hypothetical protein